MKQCRLFVSGEGKRKPLVFCLLSAFFFVASIVTQEVYNRSLYHPIPIKRVQTVLYEKESYARSVLTNFRKALQSGHLERVYEDENLYEESEKQEISFHIYKGEDLLYWSNNIVALRDVDKLDNLPLPFVRADNADVVVLQSFCREYRCVALIKMKDNVFPKKNDPNNQFAAAFHLPGTVVLKNVGEKGTTDVCLKSGEAVFALDHLYLSDENYVMMTLTVVFWFFAISFLFFSVSSWMGILPNLYAGRPNYVKFFKYAIVVVLLILMVLFAVFRIPSCWYDNGFMSQMSYTSPFVPTLSHLFLYVIFAYGFAYILYKRWHVKVLNNRYAGVHLYGRIVIVKSIPFALLFVLYALIRGIVQNSDVNLAVSYVQDLTVEALLLLLLALFWVYLYYRVLCTIRLFYAVKENTKSVVIVHIVLTVLSMAVCWCVGTGIETAFVLVVSLVILYVDLYEVYYSVSSFLYTTPIAFLLINMIVSLAYSYSAVKNRQNFQTMAVEMSQRNCVYEDEIAEAFLKESYADVRKSENLAQWVVKDTIRWTDEIQDYLLETYYKPLEEKYDLEVELCDMQMPLTVRKTNYENVNFPNIVSLSKDLRMIEATSFFVNQSEQLALSYIGILTYGAKTLYLKFYRKAGYDKLSFWEHTKLRSREVANLSKCKYKEGEVTFSEGDFHYPAQMSWVLAEGKNEDTFTMNYYIHYVHFFDDGKSCTVISVPQQQSYIYVILITYLFAAYMLVSLVYFSLRESSRRLRRRNNSLLTKMQRSFVVPVLSAFFVLALITFPFFVDQFEKSSFSEMKEKASSVQQSVRQVIMRSDDLYTERESLALTVKNLSRILQSDVILYGKNGRLLYSTRPLFMSTDKREASLVIPEIRFLKRPDVFLSEDYRSVKCYAYYTRAYNIKNECVGYISMLSDRNYSMAQSETVNVLVVIVDIYIFVTIISIFIIWLLNKQTMKPLQEVTEQISQVCLTGSNQQIDYREEDEIGELVKQYNQMVVQLKDSADRLARSEREFAWREMARRIAHEIKNPLTPMKLSVQQCLRKRSLDPEGFDDYFKKTCNILIDQIDNLSNIASEFSSFAKAAESRCEKMNIVEKLRSAVELFANNSEDVTFSYDDNGCPSLLVWMDDKQVLQIFNNLFRNAIQAIPDDRHGTVHVTSDGLDGYALIRIEDNGCGVSEENQEKMFQPNFTTKTSGMGLGLAIVKNILNSSNGDIWFESEVGKGTCFYVKIPLCE